RFFRLDPAEIVAEDPARVLRLVTFGAEILPIAAVGRVVVVIAVLVVDGQQVQVLLVELASAAGADPTVKRERAGAVVETPRARCLLRVVDHAVDVRSGLRAAMLTRTEAPGRHPTSMPQGLPREER